MKVKFYCQWEESDVYEIPDETSENEIFEMADKWVCDNVAGLWEEVDE